jgi:hypothetical protein
LIPQLILENLCAGLLPRDKEESRSFAVARQGFLTQYLGSRTSRKFKNYSNPRKYLHKDFERKIHSTRKTTAGGLSPFKGVCSSNVNFYPKDLCGYFLGLL